MKLLLLLISLSLPLLSLRANAQLLTADDFFNNGAHSYISNNIPLALQSVTNGLEIYPNDQKLKKLYELLKQQQQQQQQNQQNQQSQQNQQNQNQANQSQNNQPQKSGQQNQSSQSAADENQNNQQPGETNGQPESAHLAQMTPEDARRLLDQQKSDEQVLVMKPQGKPHDTSHPVKDW